MSPRQRRSGRTRGAGTSRLALELSRARGPFAWMVVIVVFGVIATGAILNNIPGLTMFSSPYKVQLAVDDAKGITPGTQEVELAGVEVGTVTAERLVGDRPVLTLAINHKYAPLYKNARFEIRPNTPLEDLYVDIVNRGTPGAGKLSSQTIVPADQTQTPVDISRVLDVFQPDVRQEMGVALDELSKGTPDNGLHLDEAFEELAPFLSVANSTMSVVNQRKQLVAQASTSFTNVVDALGQRDKQLQGLITSGNSSLAELAANNGPFNSTLAELPGTLSDLQTTFSALRSTEGQLDPALKALEPVAGHLKTALGSLSDIAQAGTPALTALKPALDKLSPLATQLQPTANQLSATVSALRPQAPELNHITSLVVPCLPSLSGFFNNTISVFKYYDGYGTWPRGNTTFDDSSLTNTGTANLTQYTSCTGSLK